MSEAMLVGIVAAAAAIAGPLLAVWITRRSDERKDVVGRRMDIFRTLMRTRKMPIHYDHVGALNLIEIEFAHDEKVIAAWKDYFRKLNEHLTPDTSQHIFDEVIKQRQRLLTKLISEIAQVLNFKVEQLDILDGSYIPQGWSDEDTEQRIVRNSLIEVLGGRRPILFQPYSPTAGNGPYPPAPQIDDQQ
ncbi:DUF6680 family protein [Paracoccus sp. SSK6]|uniref:DUF6680 family protein n=1 Tax=Paracoccus sp. SSK6 TaxID=3143131 RepID=UPI00321B97ED